MRQPSSYVAGDFWAGLHGLRGIAVLYVLFSHMAGAGLALFPVPHGAIGKVGVWIFFSLSAFLLTSRLRSELRGTSSKPDTLITYFVHRFFRIYPLFVVALATHAIVGDFPFSKIFDHLLLQEGHGGLWAIPVEFKYYFVIPIIALAASTDLRHRQVLVVLAVVLFSVTAYGIREPGSIFINQLNPFPHKLAPFITGSMLALVFDPDAQSQRKTATRLSMLLPYAGLTALIGATVALRFMKQGALPTHFAPWVSLVISLAVVALIYSAFQGGIVSRVLRSTPLVFVGEISFSIYLFQNFVIRQMVKIDLPSPTLKAWLSVAVVLLCAWITYWAIERPGIRAGKVFGKKLKALLFTGHGLEAARSSASEEPPTPRAP